MSTIQRGDRERLIKIIRYWEALSEQISDRGITSDQILKDRFIQWAITTPIYNIGEHTYNLSGEFKKSHPDIPWSRISGLRHRLVHDYEGTNWVIIEEVVSKDLPEYVSTLKKMLEE